MVNIISPSSYDKSFESAYAITLAGHLTPEMLLQNLSGDFRDTRAGNGLIILCPNLSASLYPLPSDPKLGEAFPPVARINFLPLYMFSSLSSLTVVSVKSGRDIFVTFSLYTILIFNLSHSINKTDTILDACSELGYM